MKYCIYAFTCAFCFLLVGCSSSDSISIPPAQSTAVDDPFAGVPESDLLSSSVSMQSSSEDGSSTGVKKMIVTLNTGSIAASSNNANGPQTLSAANLRACSGSCSIEASFLTFLSDDTAVFFRDIEGVYTSDDKKAVFSASVNHGSLLLSVYIEATFAEGFTSFSALDIQVSTLDAVGNSVSYENDPDEEIESTSGNAASDAVEGMDEENVAQGSHNVVPSFADKTLYRLDYTITCLKDDQDHSFSTYTLTKKGIGGAGYINCSDSGGRVSSFFVPFLKFEQDSNLANTWNALYRTPSSLDVIQYQENQDGFHKLIFPKKKVEESKKVIPVATYVKFARHPKNLGNVFVDQVSDELISIETENQAMTKCTPDNLPVCGYYLSGVVGINDGYKSLDIIFMTAPSSVTIKYTSPVSPHVLETYDLTNNSNTYYEYKFSESDKFMQNSSFYNFKANQNLPGKIPAVLFEQGLWHIKNLQVATSNNSSSSKYLCEYGLSDSESNPPLQNFCKALEKGMILFLNPSDFPLASTQEIQVSYDGRLKVGSQDNLSNAISQANGDTFYEANLTDRQVSIEYVTQAASFLIKQISHKKTSFSAKHVNAQDLSLTATNAMNQEQSLSICTTSSSSAELTACSGLVVTDDYGRSEIYLFLDSLTNPSLTLQGEEIAFYEDDENSSLAILTSDLQSPKLLKHWWADSFSIKSFGDSFDAPELCSATSSNGDSCNYSNLSYFLPDAARQVLLYELKDSYSFQDNQFIAASLQEARISIGDE